MSGGEYRNRPSFHVPGKEFLIVIVVVFSSLSFTLGYFVGESRKDSAPPPVPITETVPPQTGMDAYSATGTEAPGGADNPAPAEGAAPDGTAKETSLPGEKAGHDRLSGRDSNGEPSGLGDAVSPSASKGKLQKSTISYTVQIGAFSTEKDAEVLRDKYEKKRYKAYIVPGKNKRGETIYKIRIGEFKNRKDAELLSLKLKKTEELNTFVTFKD